MVTKYWTSAAGRWMTRLAIGCIGFATAADAQIRVNARLAVNEVLQYEPVQLELKITNDSGQTLTVGDDSDVRFDILVEKKPGFEVPRTGQSLLAEAVSIPVGSTRTIEVDLTRAYDLRSTGAVTIVPRLRYAGQKYTARRLLMDVVPGLVLKEHRFGVPDRQGDSRVCTVRTLQRDRAQRVFLRIESKPAEVCHGVYDLGRLVSNSSVSLESDRVGRIHVLHQSGPARYTHSVFSVEGEPLSQLFYNKGGNPRLERTDEGLIELTGVREYDGDPTTQRPMIRAFDPSR